MPCNQHTVVPASGSSIEARCNIRNIEPTTSTIKRNVYHLHTPLFILDAIRLFQDHPKFAKGLNDEDLVEIMSKETFACGDLMSQVKIAIRELLERGFVRLTKQGYRTLGPFARLGLARNARQFNAHWDRIAEMQRVNLINSTTSSSISLRKRTC